MQALSWYHKRLKAMSFGEITWRMKSSKRNLDDWVLVRWRQRLRALTKIVNVDGHIKGLGGRVSDVAIEDRSWLKTKKEDGHLKYNDLIARAKRIASHRLDFFDLKDMDLGDPINWNRDHKRGQDTPMIFSPSLDYRDVNKVGDCKYVWEPNRHHQLVVLGRAYRLSGDKRFADAVAEQMESWLTQNPYGIGMNWRSGLELGIRLINWVWAIDLIKESKAIGKPLQHRILDSVSRHIWEIERKYSRGSSVNNHLIGEAAGVFVAASYFPYLKKASSYRIRSRDILCREILRQTFPDGGTVEQAIGYHFFVLQFFVVVGITARNTGHRLPESYWPRLEKMFEFVATLSQGGDCLPLFGDCDDGYVLDLGSDPHSVKEWLAVGAALFDRSDLKTAACGASEPVRWLLGKSEFDCYNSISEIESHQCASTALDKAGYYLLQNGTLDSPDRISVVFDCGPLGMKPMAGHGHADALSFTLRAFGRDVLVDPGTYDYFSYPEWRKYFRSTRAHNTIVIDGLNQSEMLGSFLWGKQAEAECLNWQPTGTGGKVVGRHDGYMHLADPVSHKRMIDLDGRDVVIRDDIFAKRKHKVEVFFHLAEHCQVKPVDRNRYLVDTGSGTVTIDLDPILEVEVLKGSEDPICGWVSRGYHHKQASTTLIGRCVGKGNLCLVCRMAISKPKRASARTETK